MCFFNEDHCCLRLDVLRLCLNMERLLSYLTIYGEILYLIKVIRGSRRPPRGGHQNQWVPSTGRVMSAGSFFQLTAGDCWWICNIGRRSPRRSPNFMICWTATRQGIDENHTLKAGIWKLYRRSRPTCVGIQSSKGGLVRSTTETLVGRPAGENRGR